MHLGELPQICVAMQGSKPSGPVVLAELRGLINRSLLHPQQSSGAVVPLENLPVRLMASWPLLIQGLSVLL